MKLFVATMLMTFLMLSTAFGHVVDPNTLHLPHEEPGEFVIIEGNWDDPKPPPSIAKKPKPKIKNPSTTPAATPIVSATMAEAPRAEDSGDSDDVVVKNEDSYSLLFIAKYYIVLGFEHILPMGTDHILFILGLFFLSTSLRSIVMQVSLFTLAHTLTLTMSSLQVVSLPGSIVEPIIAASIVFVAAENIYQARLNNFRLILIFIFGLLHGMGFAGALAEVGLPQENFIPALLSFNVGVELGQLTVVLIAFALTYWCQKKSWYRQRIVIPVSLLIALTGLYWTVTRIWG